VNPERPPTHNIVALNEARFARRFSHAATNEALYLADDVRDALFAEFGYDPPHGVRRACALYALRRCDFLWTWGIEQLRSLISHTPPNPEMEARIARMLDGLFYVRVRELHSAAAKVALMRGVNGPASWEVK
jgi:hypothetical protein